MPVPEGSPLQPGQGRGGTRRRKTTSSLPSPGVGQSRGSGKTRRQRTLSARAAVPESTPGPASEEDRAKEGIQIKKLLKQFWSVASPYWMTSEDRGQARIRLVGVLVLTLATTAVRVAFNYLGRDFFNALESRNEAEFVRQLFLYLGGYILGIPVFAFRDYLTDTLALRWRAWLTKDLVGRYLGNKNFYDIQTQSLLDNPDQRINDDVTAFTSTALSFFLNLFNSVVDLVSFSGILYSIYPPLFGVVFAYAAAGTLISAWLGKDLVGLNFLQEKKEADFRYGLVRVRENAESIAFYGGETSEGKTLLRYFKEAVKNYARKLVVERNLSFFTLFYQYLIQLLPVAILASLFFRKQIEFGQISQASSAFNNVLDDCSVVVYQFQSFSAFSAVIERLGEFKEVITQQEQKWQLGPSGTAPATGTAAQLQEQEPALVATGSQGEASGLQPRSQIELLDVRAPSGAGQGPHDPLLELRDVSVATPSYSSYLLSGLSLSVRPGEHLLVQGPSGAGKTSLLRAIAGLWRAGKGIITRAVLTSPPEAATTTLPAEPPPSLSAGGSIFFVPQKPYMVLGNLRDQLIYPTWASQSEESAADGDKSQGASSQGEGPGAGLGADEALQQAQVSSVPRPPPSDAELREVLTRVCLGYLAERWEGGMDAEVEWASTLSLGEQQRIAFARLLLSRPRLALLDEATSALDEKTEALLYELLQEAGVTFVSVGHRSTLRHFHKKALSFEGQAAEGSKELQGWDQRTGSNTSSLPALRLEQI